MYEENCNENIPYFAFIDAFQLQQITLTKLIPTLKAYSIAMQLEMANQSVYPVFSENDLAICNLLVNNFGLQHNTGINKSKDLLLKVIEQVTCNI